jgi:hypothetical protein
LCPDERALLRAEAARGGQRAQVILCTTLREAENLYIQGKQRSTTFSARNIVAISMSFFEENRQGK